MENLGEMAERLNALPWKGEKRIRGVSQEVVDILGKYHTT